MRVWHAQHKTHEQAYAAEHRVARLKATAAWFKRNPEKAAERTRRRYAAERAVTTEPVDYKFIAQRDKGMCGLCHKQIEPHERPSFDHIIPISKGGPHSIANIQLAHLICNLRKGNRLDTAA